MTISNLSGLEIQTIHGTCTCENNVSLLGFDIDFMLTFHDHVADICKKASKQLADKKDWADFFRNKVK